MELDGLFYRSKIIGNLLVEAPGDNMRKHFAFAPGQSCNLLFDRLQLGVYLTRANVALFRAGYRFEQVTIAHRFGQEIDGAALHRAHARWNIALASDENDRSI